MLLPSSLTPRQRRGERKVSLASFPQKKNCRLHFHHRACQAGSDAAFVFATDLNVADGRAARLPAIVQNIVWYSCCRRFHESSSLHGQGRSRYTISILNYNHFEFVLIQISSTLNVPLLFQIISCLTFSTPSLTIRLIQKFYANIVKFKSFLKNLYR